MSFVVQHVSHFALTAGCSSRLGLWLSDWSPGRTDGQNESEAQSKEACPQQVPESREVGDGEVIRVQAPLPQPLHHHTGRVEQDDHLDPDTGGEIHFRRQ